MSSFSGLSTALSSLIAQRQALDVAGQNVANANTPGYTRQRVTMSPVSALAAPTMFSSVDSAGYGVRLNGIDRVGDIFLDARVRSATSTASYQAAGATTLSRLESTLTEPADTGLASSLQTFWAGWQDVANNADDAAARKVLVGSAESLTKQVAAGYRAVETQWSQTRTDVETLAVEVNTTADAVAHLNEQIRGILVSGGSANELMDERDLLVTKLSGLVGGEARHRDDGTLDVMVGGNALVRGVTPHHVQVRGSFTMAGAVAEPPATPDPVRLVWAETGTALTADGGTVASHVSALAPASSGGVLAATARGYDAIATALHDAVNAVHAGGARPDGTAGGPFFALAAGLPPAVALSVAVAPSEVAAATPGAGAYDGSVADRISQLATASGGPDTLWREMVVDLGVQTRTATQRANVTEAARATAENLQLAQSSVDLDEETITMLAYQRAYEGAARVLTAIDEMLDVLINRTGVVGR